MNLVARSTAATFRALSRLRGRRIFHPHGVGFAATFYPEAARATGGEIFDSAQPRPAVVRLSRALGLPEALPDPCGLAVRLLDAYGPQRHQDFLLVTSGRSAGARHLLLPAPGFTALGYSSLLPYRVGGRLGIVGAGAVQPDGDPTLADLRARESAGMEFAIELAAITGGWRRVGRLELGDRLPATEVERLRFDPANTGGGIELAGIVNRLRKPAYRGSQEGRGAA
jgi:hypothetical protein